MTPLHQDLVNALKGFVTIIRDPDQTDAVFAIGRGLQRLRLGSLIVRGVRQRAPEAGALIAERYLPPSADLDELIKLPAGSLGRTFAENMRRGGFTVEFYPKWQITDDSSYLVRRIQQTHDIWHTVTGFGTDPAGELGLQAFMLVQMRSPISVVLLLAGLIGASRQPGGLRQMMAQVRRGVRLGKTARPLLAQRWEDGWERPLSEWRAAVGLPAAA